MLLCSQDGPGRLVQTEGKQRILEDDLISPGTEIGSWNFRTHDWREIRQRDSNKLQRAALCNTFPFWKLAVMTGQRRAEQREHQNSIIWSFFHKLFHSCSNPLEQTFGRGRNASTEPSDEVLSHSSTLNFGPNTGRNTWERWPTG